MRSRMAILYVTHIHGFLKMFESDITNIDS